MGGLAFARVPSMTEAQQAKRRLSDLVLAGHVLELTEGAGRGAMSKAERAQVADIHHAIVLAARGTANATGVLTKPQRGFFFAMAKKVDAGFGDERLAELIDDTADPAERNANVPRGREVPLAPVLQALPLKPPGRGGGVKVQS